MNIIDKIKERLKRGYQCDCPKHRPKEPLSLGFVMSYIGVAISISGLDGIDEKKYCSLCHPQHINIT